MNSGTGQNPWASARGARQKYRFPRFTLRPGKTVTVRSGQGTDTRTTLYWGRKWYVWNNDGDRASLYRGSDLKKIDACDWGRGGTSTRCR
ncbi:lamin tail domain-containing protein [Nonomuraea phyllanthi]|uniref:lamin tail domain-containing protein n=1 Tax=Nonomuraea phyllanthi TaxID=2219224 RepID=UPI001D027BDB|nr:lamin tail domain-containing protein [Nonomuraea phyllanthi]